MKFFYSVDSLCYKLTKINLNGGGPHFDSHKWLKNEKAAVDPKNNDGKCFQHAITVALNFTETKSHPEKIWKIKPFIEQCNWK